MPHDSAMPHDLAEHPARSTSEVHTAASTENGSRAEPAIRPRKRRGQPPAVHHETSADVSAFNHALLAAEFAVQNEETADDEKLTSLPGSTERAATEHAGLLALSLGISEIPATEWHMPATLWAIHCQGGASAVAESFHAALRLGHEFGEREATVFNAEMLKEPAKWLTKSEPVIILDQSFEAKACAKLALAQGKFVAWVHRAPLDGFGRANARGQAKAHSFAHRLWLWTRLVEDQGLAPLAPDGATLSDSLLALFEASVPSESARIMACGMVEKMMHLKSTEISPIMERLARLAGPGPREEPNLCEGDPLLLADVVGLAEPARAQLLLLSRRLRQPGGRGVLLHGLPGTGKTMLAKIIALESSRHWVGCSYGEWQACEHLGQHLEAMAASFQEAIACTPSVLFIDEIDSVGSRARSSSRNHEYTTVVINAMLELTQRAIEAGVAVIGATNYPERVDPALTRAGRLGEWIELILPDASGRADLLAQTIPGLDDPVGWAARLGRCAPAKISELARTAGALARERGLARPGASELAESLQAELSKTLAGRDAQSLAYPTALGLCAKAWALRAHGPGAPRPTELSIEVGIEEIGRVELDAPFSRGSGSLAWLRLQVAMSAPAARLEAARKGAWADSPQALGALADLDERERSEAMDCLAELSRTGLGSESADAAAPWVDPASGLSSLATNAWNAALASARSALPFLEKGARVLAERRHMSADELWGAMGLPEHELVARPWLH